MIKKRFIKNMLLVVSIILLTVGCGNANSNAPDESNTKTESEADHSKENTTGKENITVADKYIKIGSADNPPFSVPEKSIEFMNTHEDFFPGSDANDGAMSDYVNWDISYPHLAKSVSKYTNQLFTIYGNVVDISETEDGSLTYLHVVDYNGYNYTLYYLGSLDEVFVDTEVYVYALPFEMVKFENMSAQYTEAVVGAACYVSTNLYD